MSGILVIDADTRMCEHITRDLIERGFTVVSASDGPGALELLRTWAIDAIVLDMMLPKVDGIALIPLVRRITQIPIIMVSGKFDLAMRIAALAAGADDYLLKPFDLSELAARINSALRRPLLHDAQEPNAHRSGGELLPE